MVAIGDIGVSSAATEEAFGSEGEVTAVAVAVAVAAALLKCVLGQVGFFHKLFE